ncbi:MAG: DUF2781 domain-containing protein [Spirochaetes bacterium]|nr:DUF2781 domain-containing protein [Spirochaetota bacterium]
MRETIPLKERPADIVFLAFFVMNLFFITYIVDLEQLVIPDVRDFIYPVWPLPRMVDLVHWWGWNFDPVLMARPPWWKATIWIDSLLFGPFYAAAIYAFIKGREWIRVPCFLWAGLMIANVTIIMSEEYFGPHATPTPLAVTLANLPWFLFPVLLTARMWLREHPFTRERRE